eukprot:6460337-Amphidinium_carterae.1
MVPKPLREESHRGYKRAEQEVLRLLSRDQQDTKHKELSLSLFFYSAKFAALEMFQLQRSWVCKE